MIFGQISQCALVQLMALGDGKEPLGLAKRLSFAFCSKGRTSGQTSTTGEKSTTRFLYPSVRDMYGAPVHIESPDDSSVWDLHLARRCYREL